MAVIHGVASSERDLLNKYPHAVNTIKDIDKVHKNLKEQMKQKDKGFFGRIRRMHRQWQINTIEENRNDPMHAGASGELQVLDELSKLSDDYHIMCGVEFELSNYITYKNQKNLKSAQLDFVVVSKRGIVVIEVKNWSDAYHKQNMDFSPHEQVDRGGLVLWVSLKSWQDPTNPPVTKVLLSIQSNMKYDPNFKFVLTRNLDNINSFITGQKIIFSETETKRVIDRISGHVTL